MKRLVFYFSLPWLLMLLIISNISNAQLYTSYNHSASAGVNVPSIVTPSYGGQYFNRWGVHYSACELPLKAGARITQIQFKLNSAPTSTTPFIVRLKLKNAGDTNPLCQLQYPDSWTDVFNDSNPIIECVGSFNSLDTTLKLNLPTSLGSPSFIYLGSGLEILSDSSTGDNSIPFKGYRDEQNMGLWKGNLFEALLNVKPIVKFQYNYPASQNFSGAEISNCSGANRFTKRQDVCFFIANWRMNNTQASSPNNTYQWQICSSTSPSTCYLTTSPQLITTTNSIELTSDIMQQLLVLNTSGSFVLNCTWNYASVEIASFSFSIVDDVSTSPQITNPNDSISSKITHVKFLKRPNSSTEFQPILESVTNMDDGTFTQLEFFNQLESSGDLPDLAMQGISLINFPNQLTPQLFANIQNTADAIPVLRPGEEMRLEVTMNKGMKPMRNHRMYINMDLDANQRFDSLIVLKLEETNSGYNVPINWSGNDFIDLTGGSSDTIRYQTQLFIPCDWVKDIPIKIRTGLGRLPTGWNDGEEYTIKTLCPTPLIAYSGSDTVCVNAVLPFTASVPSGCIGTYEWFDENGQSVGTNSSFTPTTSGTYTVKFTTEDCIKSSLPITIVILPLVLQYADADGDGFGDLNSDTLSCDTLVGYVLNGNDCNDANALLHTISVEICNGFDDDCDEIADDGLTFVNYYNDVDGDGFGAGTASNLCADPGVGYATNNTDCNDSNASLNSITAETCNNFDDDCDGTPDDGLTFINYYNDADGDGYGAGATSNLCSNPGVGYATNNTDCNDGASAISPVATEACNTVDDDCDGTPDDGLTFVNYYNDVDGDGFGAGAATNACQSPGATYVTSNTDCDDGASAISPVATEACNTVDDDCDALVDEGCSIGAALLSATSITSLPQFGLTGGNYSQNVNMDLESDTPENGGNYPEKWFKFVAQSNAVRIALTGASTSDDNAIAIYDDPGLSYSSPLIPIALEDDVNLSSTGVTDQGNEILLTDQLVEGNTYYVAVATVGGAPGTVNVKFNTLLPSTCDIAAYTGGTNTYSNVCSNFKCRYRQNAKQAILNRWSSSIISGGPLQSYTIPPTTIMYTVCQLSKFVPANISATPQTIYVSADVQYELLDAAGNFNYLTAVSTTTCNFTLNPEASINLRSTDACPNFKTTTTSLATDRSVCGTSQYQWEFTQAFPVVGLPLNVNGSVGGSRILGVNSIPGIANGHRYDVRIRSLHNDAVTYSGWSAVPSCFKTLGAAGMVPWSNNDEQKLTEEMTVVHVYPNPLLQGGHAQLRSSRDIHAVQIFDAAGQLLSRIEGFEQLRSVELPSPEVAGLYWVVVRTDVETHRLAWLVQ